MQDLSNVIVGARPRVAHLASFGVGKGRPRFFLRVALEVDEQAVAVLVPILAGAPARVARLEGEQAFVVEVGAHAPEQRLLVSVRQEGLEGVAGQEDEPEPLVSQVERARVALDPAYGQTDGLGARPFQHAGDDVQAGHGEPLARDGYCDPAGAASDLEHRSSGLLCESRVERDTRVAAVLPVVVDRIGVLLQVVVVDQRLPPLSVAIAGRAFRRSAPVVLLAPDHRSTTRPDLANASPRRSARLAARGTAWALRESDPS